MEVIPDEDGNPVEYRSCPNLWFKTPIVEFFAMQKYLEKHPHTAPPYHERRPRYVAIERYYASVLSEFEELKAEGSMHPPIPGAR